jgi:hypothetical protein
MPETAPDLSENGLEMATAVPSGALSLNLKYMFSSVKSSNVPVIVILLNAENWPRSTFSRRIPDAALHPGFAYLQRTIFFFICEARHTAHAPKDTRKDSLLANAPTVVRSRLGPPGRTFRAFPRGT